MSGHNGGEDGNSSTDGDPSSDSDERPGVLGMGTPEDPIPQPVEPGSPTLENAAFVLLGVASMIALIVHLVSLL